MPVPMQLAGPQALTGWLEGGYRSLAPSHAQILGTGAVSDSYLV